MVNCKMKTIKEFYESLKQKLMFLLFILNLQINGSQWKIFKIFVYFPNFNSF